MHDHRIEAGLDRIRHDAEAVAQIARADAAKAAAYARRAWAKSDKRFVIAGAAVVTAIAAVGIAYAILKD